MNKQTNNTSNSTFNGIILILVGGIFMLNQMFNIQLPQLPELPDVAGFMIMPAIGSAMILLGMLTRKAGWFIPGGIVGSIGAAIFVEDNPLNWAILSDLPEGAPFMFAFAAGWFSIVILTALFADEWQWWAIIPGTIFALIGGTVAYGGLFELALIALGKAWPVILIAIGVKVMLSRDDMPTHKLVD